MAHEYVSGVVIEPGSYSLRIGVAGDVSPLCVVPSAVLKDNEELGFNIPVAASVSPTAEVWTPVVDGVVEDVEAASQLWEHYTRKVIGVDLSEQPLTVTEQVWTPKHARKRLVEQVFEGCGTPVLQLLKDPLAAAFESAKPTALVVSIGGSVVSSVPVVEGVVRSKALVRTPFAGDFVDAHILTQLQHTKDHMIPQYQVEARLHGLEKLPAAEQVMELKTKGTESYHNFQLSRLLDNIKRVCCVVSPTPLKGPEIRGTKNYQMPNGYSVLLGPERYATAEPLFQPTLFALENGNLPPSNSLGLVEAVYQSLQKVDAPPEVVSSLLSNVVVHGGSSNIPGLLTRFELDFASLAPTSAPGIFHARGNPVWTGASVFASLGEYHESNWITKQQYDEQGENIVLGT